MFVGYGWVILHLPAVTTLKEKRRIIQSALSDLRLKFKVAASEVGFHDKWQRAQIGFASVGSSLSEIEVFGRNVFQYFDELSRVEVTDRSFQIV